MRFTIGIATKQKLDGTFMVCASTWFAKKPKFSLSKANIEEMRKELISLVYVECNREPIAVNTAITRTVEQLFLRGLIANPLNDYPPIIIHAPASTRVVSSQYKFTPAKGCWLINCSKRALEEIYESRVPKTRRYETSCRREDLCKVPKKVPSRRPNSSRAYLSKFRNGFQQSCSGSKHK